MKFLNGENSRLSASEGLVQIDTASKLPIPTRSLRDSGTFPDLSRATCPNFRCSRSSPRTHRARGAGPEAHGCPPQYSVHRARVHLLTVLTSQPPSVFHSIITSCSPTSVMGPGVGNASLPVHAGRAYSMTPTAKLRRQAVGLRPISGLAATPHPRCIHIQVHVYSGAAVARACTQPAARKVRVAVRPRSTRMSSPTPDPQAYS